MPTSKPQNINDNIVGRQTTWSSTEILEHLGNIQSGTSEEDVQTIIAENANIETYVVVATQGSFGTPYELATRTNYIFTYTGSGDINSILPATSAVGDVIKLIHYDSFILQTRAGQTIRLHSGSIASGAEAYLYTSDSDTTVHLVCTAANTAWYVALYKEKFPINLTTGS